MQVSKIMRKEHIRSICLAALLFLTGSLFYSCKHRADYQKTRDGVIISPEKTDNGARKVRLQVVDPHIIRVTASPSGSFSRPQSLMTVDRDQAEVKWKVQQQNDSLVLTTSALKAIVLLNTGQVQFMDTAGNILLKGKRNGRTFIPDTVEDVPAYHIRQVWKNTNHDALYGLGGNQLGLTNLREKDLALIQCNSEAFVPFLVSSGHYGILWDNNSITHFGDPKPYLPLDSFKLYNAEGEPGGLTATYFPEGIKTQAGLPAEASAQAGLPGMKKPLDDMREERTIDYEFLKDLEKLPDGFSLAHAIIEWNGYIESPYSGTHIFRLYWGGYVKVWIDGDLLFPSPPFISPSAGGGQRGAGAWRQCWNPAETRLKIPMEKGKKYHLKIKWIPDGAESFLSLKWKRPAYAEASAGRPANHLQNSGASAATPTTESARNQISLASEMGQEIDYYFISGKNMDSVISGYRKLTGKAPIMPIWAYGFWQSREHYGSQKEILNVVKEFRQRKIPLDNIVQDWFYWKKDQWGSQQFDSTRYPDPAGMIKALHEKYHTHFMISVWPKFYIETKPFKKFWNKDWLYKKNVEDSTKDWVGYVSTFYDAFNEDARKAFWNLVNKKLFSLGVDAWWLDATEPDIVSNTTIQTRKALMDPTALGPSTQYFNAYPLEQSKAFYNGQRSVKPNQRVFILTRSAFAGSQRYAAATWSGDIGATWRDMKNQIATGISFSMSGIPYWTMDIGGFATEKRYQHPDKEDLEEWREQMTRWYQFGAFCPLFRAHGQLPYREPFNIAPENSPAYESIVYYDKLRYRLLPYIYSLAGAVYLNNYTIMRSLVMDFPKDSMARNITDEYLFGPGLLINPVYTYKARKRKVYLPTLKLRQTGLPSSTGWYNLYNGKYYSGGQTISANAPYTRMPVFVKAGAIIAFGPALQYTQQKPADTITLFVYTGRDGHFNLYEDDGLTYDYEKGAYSIIPLVYHETGHTLTIGKRKGSFESMLKKRVFKIKWISPEKPEALDFNAPADKVVNYGGSVITVTSQ